jgi:PPIC-type PPIASE domain
LRAFGIETRSNARLFLVELIRKIAFAEPMSSSISSHKSTTPVVSTNPLSSKRWWQEPLIHFALLGALLFIVDQQIFEKKDDPKTIVVPAAVTQEAQASFKATRNRDPNAEELQALVQRWLDTEVLFREGLKLQLDQGDQMIRERVIFKSLMSFEGSLPKPVPDEKTLRAWLETKREKYDEPARHDFEEAVLEGEATVDAIKAFALSLNKGAPSDTKAGLRVFKDRPRSNIVQSYGEEFAKALEGATPDEWRALQSKDAWRIVRLKAITPPTPAKFEAIAHILRADWIDATSAQLRTDTVRQRAKNYTIRYEKAANE